MKTIFIDYPTDFSFKTKKTFASNEERTKHLHQVLRRKKVETPLHDYSDYVVEDFSYMDYVDCEYWIVGS